MRLVAASHVTSGVRIMVSISVHVPVEKRRGSSWSTSDVTSDITSAVASAVTSAPWTAAAPAWTRTIGPTTATIHVSYSVAAPPTAATATSIPSTGCKASPTLA